jgi:hypothetical protein
MPLGYTVANVVWRSRDTYARLCVEKYDADREPGFALCAAATAFAMPLTFVMVRLVRRITGNRELRQPPFRHLAGGEATEQREDDPQRDHITAAADHQMSETREHG